MKAILPLIEKYLGPKASAAAASGITAYGQLESALISSPEGVTAIDLVMHAIGDGNLAALLPAPLAGIAAFVMRSANPEKPVEEPYRPPSTDSMNTMVEMQETIEAFKELERHVDKYAMETTDRVNALDSAVKGRLLTMANDIANVQNEIRLMENEPPAKSDIENLPLNLRQNNPGNIESTVPGKQRWKGEQDSTNRYAVFETPAHGVRAMLYLLRKVYFARHNLTTVHSIIHRWAPLGDNSPESVANYIKSVSEDLRVQPQSQLSLDTDDDQLVTMLKSMAEFEGGRPLPYNKSVYTKALELLK